jgi:hypothetical protein
LAVGAKILARAVVEIAKPQAAGSAK